MIRARLTAFAALTGVSLFASSGFAHPHTDAAPPHSHDASAHHENGIGPDPDNDTNPATDTGGISLEGNAATAADDAPYSVITFEPPPGRHGDAIGDAYEEEFGVRFGGGLKRQICNGQRHYFYDSVCSYEAAPSGQFAAVYNDQLNAPLSVEFNDPVCVITMAAYPTGGKDEEPFEVVIDAWTAAGAKLPQVKVNFVWTKQTIRWRNMAGAFYLNEPAKKFEISMKSKDPREAKKTLRFLLDDFAFVETGCEDALAAINSAS